MGEIYLQVKLIYPLCALYTGIKRSFHCVMLLWVIMRMGMIPIVRILYISEHVIYIFFWKSPINHFLFIYFLIYLPLNSKYVYWTVWEFLNDKKKTFITSFKKLFHLFLWLPHKTIVLKDNLVTGKFFYIPCWEQCE